jgi:hypothetical protein
MVKRILWRQDNTFFKQNSITFCPSVFALINFPVAGGISGHLMGAPLAVALFGLYPGVVVVMASIILIHCQIDRELKWLDEGIEARRAKGFDSVKGMMLSNQRRTMTNQSGFILCSLSLV